MAATSEADTGAPAEPAAAAAPNDPTSRPTARLRHYVLGGSMFIDDDYLIKGVAGRLPWKVVAEHIATGRTAFTNREARLDPALELPPFRDNFESRLILLKRRLDERRAPVRIRSPVSFPAKMVESGERFPADPDTVGVMATSASPGGSCWRKWGVGVHCVGVVVVDGFSPSRLSASSRPSRRHRPRPHGTAPGAPTAVAPASPTTSPEPMPGARR